MPREEDYRITIDTSIIFQSGTSKAVINRSARHELNEGSEAWVLIESDDITGIEAGQEMKIEIVPWGGSAFEQIFYGEIFDILAGEVPDQIRILARDIYEYMEEVDVDTIFTGAVHNNEDLDIVEDTFPLYPKVDLGVDIDDIPKPITRVQVANLEALIQRPDPFAAVPSVTNIADPGTGDRQYLATRFLAEADRAEFIGWEGTSNADWDYFIVEQDPATGFPDLTQQLVSAIGISPISGFHSPTWNKDIEFRLRPGRYYWVVITPNDPFSAYDFDFFSSPSTTAPSPLTDTGEGVSKSTDIGVTWSWDKRDKVGHLKIRWIKPETRKELEEWTLEEDGGSGFGIIRFGGTDNYYPQYVKSGSFWQQGARVFFFEGDESIDSILDVLLEKKCNIDYKVIGTLDLQIFNALETKCGEAVRAIMTGNDWRLRQLHRTEGGDNPPLAIAEVRPSFGSPVLALKAGWDSSDPSTEARAVNDALQLKTTNIFTGVRILGKNPAGELIYYERHDPDLEQELELLSIAGSESGLRKAKIIKARNLGDIDQADALAQRVQSLLGVKVWEGNLTVDGATWIVPGDTITYQNSRKGIPLTEFRVRAVEYIPHQMILSLNSTSEDLTTLFRTIDEGIGKAGIVQSLTVSDLDHDFYVDARKQNSTYRTGTEFLGTLLATSGGSIRSSQVVGTSIVGPTENGQPSRIVWFYFPPETQGGKRGTARFIEIDRTAVASIEVELNSTIYHWAENGCAVIVYIHE